MKYSREPHFLPHLSPPPSYHLSISSIAQWRYNMSGLLDDALLAEPLIHTICHYDIWYQRWEHMTWNFMFPAYNLAWISSYYVRSIAKHEMVCITTAVVIRYPHLPARTSLARIKSIELLTSRGSSISLSCYNSSKHNQGNKGLQDSLQLSRNGARKDKNYTSSG